MSVSFTAFLRDESGSTGITVSLIAALGVPSLLLAGARLSVMFEYPLASFALGLR
jgi:Flp pilus assembly pilin Flp